MKKRIFSLLVCGFILITGVLISPAFASSWGEPWSSQPDVNMHMLITDGYKIVGTNYFTVGMAAMEFIYLRKDNQIYRCFTGEQRGRSTSHECALSVSPKKNR